MRCKKYMPVFLPTDGTEKEDGVTVDEASSAEEMVKLGNDDIVDYQDAVDGIVVISAIICAYYFGTFLFACMIHS